MIACVSAGFSSDRDRRGIVAVLWGCVGGYGSDIRI